MDNEHVKQEEKNLVIVGPKEYVKPEPDGGYTLEVPGYRSSRGSSSIYINPEHVDKITVLVQPFNAYSPAKVEGPAVLWSYADGHGMELGAVLERGKEFTLWVPDHHDHGPGEKYKGFVGTDGEISCKTILSAEQARIVAKSVCLRRQAMIGRGTTRPWDFWRATTANPTIPIGSP